MSKLTLLWGKFIIYCLIILTAIFANSHHVFAVQYQQCATDSTCTIGEFLYDDNYSPISIGTSCSYTSRNPNGDLLVNSQNMVGTADGWYSYAVGTSGFSDGIYRGQMCCNTSGENICLDKTFEISTTPSSLVNDIWASPNRALTTFGNLINDVWGHPSSIGNSNTLNSIGSSLTVLSAQISSVDTKIVTIDSKVDSLASAVSSIQSDTTNILNKWSTFSVSDIINYIDTLETQLGTNTQTCADNSVFGHIQCLSDKWGSQSASTLYTAANNAYTTSVALRSELNFAGKSTTAYDEIITLKSYVDSLETSVGSSSDTSSTSSIFGRIKQVKEAIDTIDNNTTQLNDLLAKWGSYTATDIYDKVKNLSSEIANIDIVTNGNSYTTNNITQTTNLTELQNQVLSMRAILNVNRTLLEKLDNKPIIKSWLENGSIIFKSLITNPSSIVSQDVPFTYFLPPEVKQENIIKKSDNLEIKYDPVKGVLYATADFKLKPKETIIVEIEVKDIWSVSQEKIDSLRRQATELSTPLKNTAYFAQGITLQSDINASLDRIIEIQKPSKLPEDKIKDYRTAQIELESVNKKMDSLKEIVTQSGSIGTLSGFIGGVQTVGVWGIIAVLIAGFVLLAIYIKSVSVKNKPSPFINDNEGNPTPVRNRKKDHRPLIIAAVTGISFGLSSSFVYFKMNIQATTSIQKPMVLSATVTSIPTPIPTIDNNQLEIQDETIPTIEPTPITEITATPTPVIKPTISSKSRSIIIVPSLNSYVNVRATPNRTGTLLTQVLSGKEYAVIEEKTNDVGETWIKISHKDITGWILGELTQEVSKSNLPNTPSAKITITVPNRDTIFLYSRPSFNAPITYKITQNQSAEILLETKKWVKVVLSRINIEGWISQDFIEKNI